MSHSATNWALKQRGIKPASKIVLWHLCDRYHPDHGCFPEQKTLAHDCEMSRASINRCLDELEAKGLVKRHPRVDPVTKKQTSTFYTFSFDEAVSQSDTRQTGAVSQKQPEPCLKNEHSRVSICDTNSVSEPVREPVNTREQDLFGEKEAEKPRADEVKERFEEFWKAYPKRTHPGSKVNALAKFEKALKKVSFQDLMMAVRAYAASREGEDPQFTKGAEPWLNGELFVGWIEQAVIRSNARPAQRYVQGGIVR